MSGFFASLTWGSNTNRLTGRLSRRRTFFRLEQMEDRTLLSTSPIRIATLGDSLTDEYDFYAPDRTAAQNWVEILSSLRPTQVSFGSYSTITRGETRNQGYAQNWARSGATAVGPDVAGAGTTFIEQYNGNPSTGAPGLLTQPGGLSNVDAVTILIGGNDYEARLSQVFDYTITSGDAGWKLSTVLGLQVLSELQAIPIDILTGVGTAVQAIRAQSPTIPIVLISTPDVGDTPLVINANATLNTFLPAGEKDLLLKAFHSIADANTANLKEFAADNNLKFIDLDNLIGTFVANPVVDGTYIDPLVGGPAYTSMFVGDNFHPGTVAQSVLANAIVAQLNTIFPGAITPLSNSEIIANAKAVQPVTQTLLTSSTDSALPGAPITFTAHVYSFPNINSTTTSVNFSTVPPTGTVAFYDLAQGNKLLGITNLVPVGKGPNYTESTASITISTLGTGIHEIVAVYSGDSVYPDAATQTAVEYVGTAKQVQLFTFVRLFQTQLNVQISEPQLNNWTRQLDRGAQPQHVARAIMRYVYFHTKLPRQEVNAVLRQAGLARARAARRR